MAPGPVCTSIGYSIPPLRSDVMASVYEGYGYGPKRWAYCSRTAAILAAYGPGSSPTPESAATVTATGPGALAVAVAVRKWPMATARSGTAVAVQRPCPSGVPVASTSYPAGAVTVRSKSAAGVIAVSPCTVVGGSSAHPWPGSQATTGKNDPSRSASPALVTRSEMGLEVVSDHGMAMVTVAPAATGRAITSVVASGRDESTAAPSTVTEPTSRRAPAAARSGLLGQSRNTIRSVPRSGVNRTVSAPCTVRSPGCTSASIV